MSLDTVILALGIVAEATIILLILWRSVWRSLPIFSAYVAFTLSTDFLSSLILAKSPVLYGRYYLAQTAADAAMQFLVIVEIAWSVLAPVRKSLPPRSLGLLTALIAFAGLVMWPLAALTVPSALTGLNKNLFHLQETVAILRIACFLIMASFSQALAIGWRDRELQIASGLGFYSIVSLTVTMLHSHQDLGSQYHLLDQGLSLCYVGTASYWVACFANKVAARKEFSPQMQELLIYMSGGGRAARLAIEDIPQTQAKKRAR